MRIETLIWVSKRSGKHNIRQLHPWFCLITARKENASDTIGCNSLF